MQLKVDRVSKQYKNKIAVDRVSFTLQKGVTGLLGANGAGKTTLLRIIANVLKPISGSVAFENLDSQSEEYRNYLGYLPQDFGYYPEFSGLDFLMYVASLKGIEKTIAKRRINELLKLVNLEDVAKNKIKTYSGGMKQRLGIAQALLNKPKIIVLDEPTAGLDVKERARFRDMIHELGKENIVLLSTHIVSDLEKVADRILIMKEGQIVYDGKDVDGDLEKFYLEMFGGTKE